ncbi:MAG TPA: PKD domain-containing protein [Planctomycetota bacterium]|nr:PKD domain-containing protein [Planctomycetota bacterium]
MRRVYFLCAVFALLSVPSLFALDTDGDTFSDQFELSIGTDETDAAATPLGLSGPPKNLFLESVGVQLDFANSSKDRFSIKGNTGSAGTDPAKKSITVFFGGLIRTMILDGRGKFEDDTTSVFVTLKGEFELRVQNISASFALSDEGLANSTVNQQPASIEVSVLFDNTYLSKVHTDMYTATAGKSGSFGTLLSGFGSSGPEPKAVITLFSAAPNPAAAGTPVTFTGSAALSGGEPSGYLDFGDGSSHVLTHENIKSALSGEVTHTYTSDGVYEAVLSVYAGSAYATTSVFVIVGKNTQVNPVDEMFSTAQIDNTGTAKLTLNISKIPGATTAKTEFTDTLGRAAEVDGLIPTKAFTQPGISIARSRALDNTGAEKGKVRKTLAIGARAAGDSGAPVPPSSEITIKKVSGKFVFNKSKEDKVDFSGEIQLPAEFNPAKPGGNKLTIAIGNNVGVAIIDEKGKATVTAPLTKAKVTFPKTGATTAKLSFTFSTTDMVGGGFDTEGISPVLRADEKSLKSTSRAVQVALVFDGLAYEVLAPVSFKVSAKGDAGQISGKKAK